MQNINRQQSPDIKAVKFLITNFIKAVSTITLSVVSVHFRSAALC